MRQRKSLYTGTLLVVALLACGFHCNNGTKNLAVASDAVAHALVNAQTAARQGVAAGAISQTDETAFEQQLVRVAQAGQVLDQAIRANESTTSVSGKVNSFLDAFNALQQSGVVGIKDEKLRLTISSIITGAESSVAIIAATVGSK